MQHAFDAHGSDKSSQHGYDRYYERHLAHVRGASADEPFNLLEIGYSRGASARAWLDIFERAHVYALDVVAPTHPLVHPRCSVLVGDQGEQATLDSVRDRVERARVIVDDGSHVPAHQLMAFNAWFADLLEPGGVYIIEDVETSYWVRGVLYGYSVECGVGHAQNIVDIFARAIHHSVNREYAGGGDDDQSPIRSNARALISSVTFGSNCIIVHKKTVAEMQRFDQRAYRFAPYTAAARVDA